MDKNEQRIRFYVTNGNSPNKYGEQDFIYSIRVIVTNTLKPSDVEVYLEYKENDELKTISSAAEKIEAGSELYMSVGEGWIYYFNVDDQREFENTLAGGKLSMNAYDLCITGEAEAGLVEIEIIDSNS